MPESALPPKYDPKAAEGRLYAAWQAARAFRSEDGGAGRPYTIVIPPPNVTGSLHLGHALNNTLQDLLIRFQRLRGRNARWIPGVDHAGLYTQVVVEKELKKEGKTRHDLGREAFLQRVWDWKAHSGDQIVQQLKLMGCSCDWDRQRFTLDEGFVRATREHFARLYREGLIYRGERITNWCPRCRTALSDLEVKHQDRKGSLWHLRYPLKGGGEVILATTRPETLLGDTAVAVHPEDERYAAIVGRTAILPLLNREIPVIADAYVDRTFGTGAVKITPGHDPNDFAIGQRHQLPIVNLLNPDATLNEHAGPYAGLDRFKARDKVVADLEAAGLLVKIEPHASAVGHCDRCGTMLEPMVTKQWYLQMRGLADRAVACVQAGDVRFIPDNMHAIFFEWMRNIQDWCISRQTWWGHRIPVWTCRTCGHDTVPDSGTAPDPTACAKCGGPVDQDPDTLDTWFTSCLWPLGTQGWPEAAAFGTVEQAGHFPTDVLVTGWDILFFWVSRMIMMSLHYTGKPPFRVVVFNSLVSDPEGKKMSKSKGNVVDPLELFDQYGTDAVRFALTGLETLKQSFRLAPDRVEHARNFMNKMWNAARFTLGELEGFTPTLEPPAGRTVADRWILGRAQEVAEQATAHLDAFRFNEYAGLLESFFWEEFCDVYLELAKPGLKDPARRPAVQWTLHAVLDAAMRLLHPVTPFISEEIWQRLPRRPGEGALLIRGTWPAPNPAWRDPQAEALMATAENLVRTLRALKHEQGLATAATAEAAALPADAVSAQALAELAKLGYLETLARASLASIADKAAAPKPSISMVVPGFTLFLKIEKPADPAAERARLAKEQGELQAVLAGAKAKLANAEYVAKAPPELVAETRSKTAEYEARLARLAERLAQL